MHFDGSLPAGPHDEWLTTDHRYLPQSTLGQFLGGDPNTTLAKVLNEGAAV